MLFICFLHCKASRSFPTFPHLSPFQLQNMDPLFIILEIPLGCNHSRHNLLDWKTTDSYFGNSISMSYFLSNFMNSSKNWSGNIQTQYTSLIKLIKLKLELAAWNLSILFFGFFFAAQLWLRLEWTNNWTIQRNRLFIWKLQTDIEL